MGLSLVGVVRIIKDWIVKKKKKSDLSRHLGLEVGSIVGQYFLKLDHLHYGYWGDDLEVDITNLRHAQAAYADFIVAHVPQGVKTILDVGCGTGHVASELLKHGYEVDCVSPCPYLKKRAGELLGDRSHIFECRFEDIDTDKKYDMVMFCESFQYIDIEKALTNVASLLNDNGHLFICDYFRKDVQIKGAMSGGHKIVKFNEIMGRSPFDLVDQLDITEQTAPNMDLLGDVLLNVVQPSVSAGGRLLQERHPWVYKIATWKYRKKLAKLERKYFEAGRSGQAFRDEKTYQLLVFKMNVPANTRIVDCDVASGKKSQPALATS